MGCYPVLILISNIMECYAIFTEYFKIIFEIRIICCESKNFLHLGSYICGDSKAKDKTHFFGHQAKYFAQFSTTLTLAIPRRLHKLLRLKEFSLKRRELPPFAIGFWLLHQVD